jgi:hypothetical protein
MSRNNKHLTNSKLSKTVYKKRRENAIDHQSRKESAESLRDYFTEERKRIENLIPWYLGPIQKLAERYIYRFYFLQIDNILKKGWQTDKIKHQCKRYIMTDLEKTERIHEAVLKQIEKDKKWRK